LDPEHLGRDAHREFDFEISASKNAGHFVAAELPSKKED
jgi:hypothetical protein